MCDPGFTPLRQLPPLTLFGNRPPGPPPISSPFTPSLAYAPHPPTHTHFVHNALHVFHVWKTDKAMLFVRFCTLWKATKQNGRKTSICNVVRLIWRLVEIEKNKQTKRKVTTTNPNCNMSR